MLKKQNQPTPILEAYKASEILINLTESWMCFFSVFSFCLLYMSFCWMVFKSFKWEKSVQVLVKVEFLTHSYSTFLEFVIPFFMQIWTNMKNWKFDCKEFFSSLECECMKAHTLHWELFSSLICKGRDLTLNC